MTTATSIKTRFTTHELSSGEEKYLALRDNLAMICDAQPHHGQLGQDSTAGFNASIDGCMFGSVLMTDYISSDCHLIRNKTHISVSAIDHIHLILVMQGHKYYCAHGEPRLVRAGDIVVSDLAQESNSRLYGQPLLQQAQSESHQRCQSSQYRTLNCVIARAQLEALVPYVHHYHGLVLQAEDPMTRVLANYLVSLNDQSYFLNQTQADRLDSPLVQLVASTLCNRPEVTEFSRVSVDQATLITVQQYIEANLSNQKLSPDQIARHAGVSRTGLFRLCEPFGGVMAMVRKRRLYSAYRTLSKSALVNVSLLAFNLGFNSPDTFSRAFKREFGFSPSDTYHLHHQGSVREASTDLQLNRWLSYFVC